jgi:hypothetical protein
MNCYLQKASPPLLAPLRLSIMAQTGNIIGSARPFAAKSDYIESVLPEGLLVKLLFMICFHKYVHAYHVDIIRDIHFSRQFT